MSNRTIISLFVAFLLTFGLLVFLPTSAEAGACEVCQDTVKTFTVNEVELGTTNTIRLKGYDSHGIKYVSIDCIPVCTPGEKTSCFTDYNTGETKYGDDVVVTGVCKAGTATCTADRMWSVVCENQVGPFVETCNGKDDDCDGYVDNQWTYDSYPLYTYCCENGYECGECGMGMKYCFNGIWQDDSQCTSMEDARPETCNGLDDDCDGVKDNVNGGNSIASTKCGCYNGTHAPGELTETCNGIDDDCDEVIDDVYDISTCACAQGAHRPGELQETCNMKDDDCNGVIDDLWLGTLGQDWPYYVEYCGMGTRCEGGYWKCNAAKDGVVCSTIGGSNNLAQDEVCDDVDNDCDGTVDEGCACASGNWTYCGLKAGECIQGRQECAAGSWSVECIGYKGPQPEICDGKDNNCDNITDNVNGGNSTASTKCKCYNQGTPAAEICNGIDDDCNGIVDDVGNALSADSSRCRCYGGIIQPGEKNETCNGIDDDCDGKIDEEWTDLGKDCGTGLCAGGKFVCSFGGNYTVCSTMSSLGINVTDKTRFEICNGIDDDCDGTIDDTEGMQSVEDTKCGCYGGRNTTEEACNHIDDDCDGAVDENLFCACFDGQTKPCGSSVGECELGRAACTGGVWGTCIGGKPPSEETCNGKDDDCDGIIDNVDGGYSVEETRCGCYGNKKPSIETCDGIDNDCNAAIDDDIDCRCSEGEEMQCGSNVGECTPGVKKCVSGKWGECSGGILPKKETCNGIDDDCNGVIDDVDGGNSIGSTRCSCYNRFSVPGSQGEIFNGIDDDCDGKVDEGFEGEEPTHCQNGIKDGDENGIDCEGSCRKICPAPVPINTWVLVFAAIAGAIAIFGIFFSSSFWKGEKKSLFDRKGRKIMALLITLFAVVSTLVIFIYVPKETTALPVKSISKVWSCSDGFPSANCYMEGCMYDGQLKMNNNQYDLPFTAPKAEKYYCTIKVATNHFGFNCASGSAETNEKTDVYLNNAYLGTTDDPSCNSMDECPKEPCVDNNYSADPQFLSNPIYFKDYGPNIDKFCAKGSVKFKISNIPPTELTKLRDAERNNTDAARAMFGLGNSENRNSITARFMYYIPNRKDLNHGWYIVKAGGGTCSGCTCCTCYEDLPIKDTWCGSAIYRPNCPKLDTNLTAQTYTIKWDSDTGDVCIKRGENEWKCIPNKLPNPPGFAFNSYCLAPKCTTKYMSPSIKNTNAKVELISFSCEKNTTVATESCPS